MIHQALYTFIFLLVFLGLIFLCELLYKRFNLKAEITRKLAHIISSLFSLVFLLTFQSYWYVIILGISFFIILFLGQYFNVFKSIESLERKTAGSYLLPISICLLFFFSRESNNIKYLQGLTPHISPDFLRYT